MRLNPTLGGEHPASDTSPDVRDAMTFEGGEGCIYTYVRVLIVLENSVHEN
jgi:hypothetical protein